VIYAVEAVTRELERKGGLHNHVQFLTQKLQNGETLLSTQGNRQR
jgi:hypothetical protein